MTSPEAKPPIGGYFELQLPTMGSQLHAHAVCFQSARAAFRSLLRVGRPRRVWLPQYICEAMAAPVEAEGIGLARYELDRSFGVQQDLMLSPGDWLVYVNYFGLCEPQVRAVLDRFAPEQVVLDHSQALYCAPDHRALANIYSARKFVGVPDGGFLVSRLGVASPREQDTGSLARSAHLLRRLAETPEAGYSDYLRAEESLADSEPRAMSALTGKLLAAIDHDQVREQRRTNFRYLQERLSAHNQLKFCASDSPVPLCYPFLGGPAGLRAALLQDRIFVPTYWPDACRRQVSTWTAECVDKLLPLPIDQRYGRAELDRMLEVVLGKLGVR